MNFSISPFIPNAPFLYPLKTSENLKVFWWFQGVEKGCIGNKWVKGFFSKCDQICEKLLAWMLSGLQMNNCNDSEVVVWRSSVKKVQCVKVPVFAVILVRIFPHSDWIRRDTEYSVQMRENVDQNNSEYGHFLRIGPC